MIHKTRAIKVWVDVDEDIADFVLYLNTLDGVRTLASCQGTIGEGGPEPYRAHVMCSWTPEAYKALRAAYDITIPEDCDGNWGYVHPGNKVQP